MKRFDFNLNEVMLSKFFPHYRIKTKPHLVEILMEATRFILIQNDPELKVPDHQAKGKMVIIVDNMSRLFFFSKNKYYSIVLPFYVIEEDEQIKISFKNLINVTSHLISQVITIIKCDDFKEQCSLDFVAPICEIEEECDENFWIFLRELLLMEDGYIRYDYDLQEYENAKENGNEHIHPLNHFDLFYSSNASFKIGLKTGLPQEEFIDFLNTKTACKYLTNQ